MSSDKHFMHNVAKALPFVSYIKPAAASLYNNIMPLITITFLTLQNNFTKKPYFERVHRLVQ